MNDLNSIFVAAFADEMEKIAGPRLQKLKTKFKRGALGLGMTAALLGGGSCSSGKPCTTNRESTVLKMKAKRRDQRAVAASNKPVQRALKEIRGKKDQGAWVAGKSGDKVIGKAKDKAKLEKAMKQRRSAQSAHVTLEHLPALFNPRWK